MFKGFFSSNFFGINEIDLDQSSGAQSPTCSPGKVENCHISENPQKKWVENPILVQKLAIPPDWPDPAITYYKCLRVFFSHNFSGIKENFRNQNNALESPAWCPGCVQNCETCEKTSKIGSKSGFWPKIDSPFQTGQIRLSQINLEEIFSGTNG